MRTAIAGAGGLLIAVIVWDAFEALVLPRRVTRRLRPARLFYRATWWVWTRLAPLLRRSGQRETYLSFFGPLSLLLLLTVWAGCLVLGFAMLSWGSGAALAVPYGEADFGTAAYASGTTFFTLGLGDVTPRSAVTRALLVVEAGLGFGFLALVIGYLPVLYQAFSRREVNITLLDARAGSPPSAGELLRRNGSDAAVLARLLGEWERWAAELLESHLSYPVLAYFRSQHDNQSWLAAITTILDASSLTMTGCPGPAARQASLTFAIGRHAVVDLAQVFGTPPRPPVPERLTPGRLAGLRDALARHGVHFALDGAAETTLSELRAMYEPYVNALAAHLRMPLPAWGLGEERPDNWRTSAWERASSRTAARAGLDIHDD